MSVSAFHSAFVLHYQPYRESSLLLQLLTPEQGLLGVVARCARKPKSPLKGLLQPFSPLKIEYFGRHDLKTLKQAENNGPPYRLAELPLWCGLYLNELLVKLLRRHDSSPAIFDLYQQTLSRLSVSEQNTSQALMDTARTFNLAVTLRLFEKQLLELLGYGLPLHHEMTMGRPIQPDYDYRFMPAQGFKIVTERSKETFASFSGKTLLAIKQHQFSDPVTLIAAKQLMQCALQALLGNQSIKTRVFLELQMRLKIKHTL